MNKVAVIGGGTIGLAIAWRAACRGLPVTVFDRACGRGASWAAAGMLAPTFEARYGEEALIRLNAESARLFPSFVRDLERASNTSVDYREHGTLLVGLDSDDTARIDEMDNFYQSQGAETYRLTSRQCRQAEPRLAPSISGGLSIPGDHQVNNRQLVEALIVACRSSGVEFQLSNIGAISISCNTVNGVTTAGGEHMEVSTVVLAAGARSRQIDGLPTDVLPDVRPVKGEILRLQGPQHDPLVTKVVRGIVRGFEVYLVPRDNGELVVGATSHEHGFDERLTAGGVHRLLDDARRLVPDVDELELVEAVVRHRPTTPDCGPILGPTRIDGLSIATGHYRNGMLLTPLSADVIVSQLLGEAPPKVAAPFHPQRFSALVDSASV